MPKKIFIGVAWPYVNGDLHIGHLAGYLIPCDIFSRYCRLRGYQTLMVSGADCHGTPIIVEAEKKVKPPYELVEEYLPRFHELIQEYGITYDIFTSTMTENHKNIVQEFFLDLLNKGYILKQKTLQFYSEKEKRFLPDRYVEGECSFCRAKEQRGDQCENCGRDLSPGDLIQPYSVLTKDPVILKETEHYFLNYEKFQKQIKIFVKNSDHWREWVYKETLGFLREGLKPRAITRDLSWGVPLPKEKIPEDLLIENIYQKRFYVWFEAVIGYFSATVEWSIINNKNWEVFWLDPKCRHYYFMGKDNLIFHTIFWPAQLIGQEKNYNLPYFPAVNHFLLYEGKKFSKSRGIILDSLEIANDYNSDNVRFYLTSILPETKDSDFKWKEFKDTINNELVDKIGNFIHRVLVFYKERLNSHLENDDFDNEIIFKIKETFEKSSYYLEHCQFVNNFNLIMDYIKFANQYFTKNKPWELLNKDRNLCEKVIFNSLQILFSLRVLIWPIIPKTAERLNKILGLDPLVPQIDYDNYGFQKLDLDKLKLLKIEPLLKKI